MTWYCRHQIYVYIIKSYLSCQIIIIYKLIKPADRKHLRAILSRTDDNKFTAVTDEGTVYFLNQAAVTFFKWTPGDELYIIINEKDKGSFAAIEAIIKK